jgi:hypothetical protein
MILVDDRAVRAHINPDGSISRIERRSSGLPLASSAEIITELTTLFIAFRHVVDLPNNSAPWAMRATLPGLYRRLPSGVHGQQILGSTGLDPY